MHRHGDSTVGDPRRLVHAEHFLNADGETRLEADRNAVSLTTGSVRLDYDLIRGLSPDAICRLPTDQLETIAAAYAGSFLSDLYLAGHDKWPYSFSDRSITVQDTIAKVGSDYQRSRIVILLAWRPRPDERVSA